jgi:hypothetical protein
MPTRIQMVFIYPFIVLACLLAVLWLPVAIALGSDRAPRIMIAADRMANTVFGGQAYETISSRSYRGQREGVKVWCVLCKILNVVEKDHCKKSDGY